MLISSEQKAKRGHRAKACAFSPHSHGRQHGGIHAGLGSQASFDARYRAGGAHRARGTLSWRRSPHFDQTHPRPRGTVRRNAILGASGACRGLSRQRDRPALFAPGSRGRPRPRRKRLRGRHAHRLRQNALLQPAGAERRSRKSRHARALPLPHQGARAGSARRAARSGDSGSTIASACSPTTATRPPTRAKPFASAATSCSPIPTCSTPASCRTTRAGSALFENLRYIVLDELHTYRGVFGSHLANVLRRLRRIARFLRLGPAIHLLFGDDCESGRAGGAPRGNHIRRDRGKRRSRGREIFRFLQSAGGEPHFWASGAATSTNPRAWPRNS